MILGAFTQGIFTLAGMALVALVGYTFYNMNLNYSGGPCDTCDRDCNNCKIK